MTPTDEQMQQAFDNTWWQMDTAPRDGTVITGRKGNDWFEMWWSTERTLFMESAQSAQSVEDGWMTVHGPIDEPELWQHCNQ